MKKSSIPNAGLGLFTLVDRNKIGEFVTYYSGDLLTNKELVERYRLLDPESCLSPSYTMEVQKGLKYRALTPEERDRIPEQELESLNEDKKGKSVVYDPGLLLDAVHTSSHVGRYINRPSPGGKPAANVKFVNPSYQSDRTSPSDTHFYVKIVTSKLIGAGEELIASYGRDYSASNSERCTTIRNGYIKQQEYFLSITDSMKQESKEFDDRLATLRTVADKIEKLKEEIKNTEESLELFETQNAIATSAQNEVTLRGRKHYLFNPVEVDALLQFTRNRLQQLQQLLRDIQQTQQPKKTRARKPA